MKKQHLSVLPLRRYSKPQYPSYTDPNPLDHPESLPYPFSQRVLQWAVGAGLIAAGTQLDAQSSKNQDTVDNPFTLQSTGLPYTPTMYGTGLPDRLSEKEVRAAAERAFAAEGISLQPQYHWKHQNRGLILDGFDPQSKTGYVFLDYNELGDGTARNPNVARAMSNRDLLDDNFDYYYRYRKNKDNQFIFAGWLKTIETTLPEKRLKAYQILLNKLEAGADDPATKTTFENLYIESYFKSPARRFIPGIIALVDRIVSTNDPKRRKKEYDRLNQLARKGMIYDLNAHKGNASYLGTAPLIKSISQIALTLSGQKPTPLVEKRWEDFELINQLVNQCLYGKVVPDSLDILIKNIGDGKHPDWIAISKLAAFANDRIASMDEIREITEEAKRGQSFVAVFTFKDTHSVVPHTNGRYHSEAKDPRKRDDWKTLSKEEQMRALNTFEEKLSALEEKEKQDNVAATVQMLEKDIHRFIQWSKAQGRY